MTIEKFIFDLAIVSSFFVACIRHQMKYNANADECVTQLPQWFDRKIVCSNEIGSHGIWTCKSAITVIFFLHLRQIFIQNTMLIQFQYIDLGLVSLFSLCLQEAIPHLYESRPNTHIFFCFTCWLEAIQRIETKIHSTICICLNARNIRSIQFKLYKSNWIHSQRISALMNTIRLRSSNTRQCDFYSDSLITFGLDFWIVYCFQSENNYSWPYGPEFSYEMICRFNVFNRNLKRSGFKKKHTIAKETLQRKVSTDKRKN